MTDTPDLAATLDQVWQILTDADVMHMAVLATLDQNGAPQARMVALRKCNRDQAIAAVHTDLHSPKIQGLRLDPRVSLHLWIAKDLVQLRLSGTVEIHLGTSAEWDQIPQANREAYGHVPAPGTPITTSADWMISPSADRFALLEINLTHIDTVSLDPNGHRRAEFVQSDGWQGQWLSP